VLTCKLSPFLRSLFTASISDLIRCMVRYKPRSLENIDSKTGGSKDLSGETTFLGTSGVDAERVFASVPLLTLHT
jgi:hypothetical protein